MQTIMFWGAATFYAVATALFFIGMAFDKEWGTRWGGKAAFAGLIPHAAAIGLRWAEVGHGPYSSRYEVISGNAFTLVAIYLIATLAYRQIRMIGVFVLPAAFLLMGWSVSTFGVKGEVPIIFKSYWLFLHIGFAKAFGASLIIATGCAVAYLIKFHSPARLVNLPEIERLDLYAYQFMLISFLFLGVMIIAGSLWAHQSWGRYWGWDPIETSSLATWLSFGIILHFRVLHRWSGGRMAWLTLVAFLFGMTTLYVVTLFVPTIHNAYLVGA
jgi:cytochrome c-type biogenesis protein CcsB